MVNLNVKTLADLPFHIAGRFPNRAILRHCRADTLIDTSGRDFFEHVRELRREARILQEAGQRR